MTLLLRITLLFLPLMARAETEPELRDAVSRVARTSYQWETTSRQRFRGETTDSRVSLSAPVEVRGMTDPRGYTQIALLPSREVPAAVTAVFREGDVVALTPLGWLRRAQLRQPHADRGTTLDGKTVRLARALAVALKATALRPAVEELFDLLVEAKSSRRENGLIVVELRDAAVEQLWGGSDARRAPEIHGAVVCKVGDEGLSEYHVVLGIGFPNSRTKKIDWSMQQWSVRFTGIGTTDVAPAEAAIAALDQDP